MDGESPRGCFVSPKSETIIRYGMVSECGERLCYRRRRKWFEDRVCKSIANMMSIKRNNTANRCRTFVNVKRLKRFGFVMPTRRNHSFLNLRIVRVSNRHIKLDFIDTIPFFNTNGSCTVNPADAVCIKLCCSFGVKYRIHSL